jgi:hypothetical protein
VPPAFILGVFFHLHHSAPPRLSPDPNDPTQPPDYGSPPGDGDGGAWFGALAGGIASMLLKRRHTT